MHHNLLEDGDLTSCIAFYRSEYLFVGDNVILEVII